MENKTAAIPKGWKMTTLGEVAIRIEYGYTESGTVEKVGPKFLRITDIQNDFIDWGNVPYCPISENDYRKYRLKIGDVVIARTGNSTGATATIKDNIEAVFASYLIRFQINEQLADFRFIDFLLRSKSWKKFVGSIKKGSAQGGANAKDFSIFPINLPPLFEQRAIAAVLSAFDDKIELLREQNKTLEATAQAIFKEWFVDFNFPFDYAQGSAFDFAQGTARPLAEHHSHLLAERSRSQKESFKPYKASGGKMVDSELGKIPEGWRVGKLGDMVDTILGGTPNTTKNEYWENGTIPWINSGKVNNFRIYEPTSYITKLALEESAAKLMPKGTVVIAITGATLGQVSRLEIESTGNQSVIGIIPNEKFNSAYTYYWVLENISKIVNNATGGAQQHINKNDVNNFEFIIAPDNMLKNYFEVANPLLEKISTNCFQIQAFSVLRDTLLPRLMNGEVRVNGF